MSGQAKVLFLYSIIGSVGMNSPTIPTVLPIRVRFDPLTDASWEPEISLGWAYKHGLLASMSRHVAVLLMTFPHADKKDVCLARICSSVSELK